MTVTFKNLKGKQKTKTTWGTTGYSTKKFSSKNNQAYTVERTYTTKIEVKATLFLPRKVVPCNPNSIHGSDENVWRERNVL